LGTPAREDKLILQTAFVSTYPPRRCGIATFTHDLAASAGGGEIAVLHPADQAPFYPAEVHHRIRKDEASDYLRTARSLNDCADVVSIQHEYGIWGGEDGERVIDFARALQVPAVVTLHTVLREPSPHQRTVLRELVSIAEASVVMSSSAAELLSTAYGVDPRRVHVIPHGVPDLPLVDSSSVKSALGLAGRDVILSFGLLGPGKGYELAIDALPAVVAEHPRALYVMVGATHPDLILREGEAYRRSLANRVADVGMEEHVQFVDRFVGKGELTQWLQAADVFVTPYPNMAQIVSGTLSYAMGAGRAVVSTPYAYASELLADGRGVLVPPASAVGLASALNEVLGDPVLRTAIGKRAYAHTRAMVWSAVGAQYRTLFADVAAAVPTQLPVPTATSSSQDADRQDSDRAPQLVAARG
jgi:glycosyltransferase involved in cell wall biosynthesis